MSALVPRSKVHLHECDDESALVKVEPMRLWLKEKGKKRNEKYK